MTSRSFKRDLTDRPLRYRTPSPPRDAFESISPITDTFQDTVFERSGTQCSDSLQNNTRRRSDSQVGADDYGYHQGAPAQGAMDAFASIALATGPNAPPRRSSHTDKASRRHGLAFVDNDGQLERPAKRARSEKLPSPELRRFSTGRGARPATSYGQPADTRVLEAELLLNFAQEARFAVPLKPGRQWHHKSASSGSAASLKVTTVLPHELDKKPEQHRAPNSQDLSHGFIANIEPGNALGGVAESNATATVIEPTAQQLRPTTIVTESALPEDVGVSASAVEDTPRTEPADVVEAQDQETTIQPTEPRISDALQNGSLSMVVTAGTYETRRTENESRAINSPVEDTQMVVDVTSGRQENRDESGSLGQGHAVISEYVEHQNTLDMQHSEENDEGALEQTIRAGTARLSPEQESKQGTLGGDFGPEETLSINDDVPSPSQAVVAAVCAACNFTRSAADGDIDSSSTSWISCDACKAWFHFACAGFKNEREVRGVDKYRCRKCKPSHGPTTFVRKSARAHSAIDYAGLHQGVLKTSDETPEHHYIKPIKEGTLTFLPETFARVRPELVTAEYFEKGHGWKEPIVVPAAWNPRPHAATTQPLPGRSNPEHELCPNITPGSPQLEDDDFGDAESEFVPDHGQDALDMVMPQGLTVRSVAELYGPEEKVEVIDVKSQNGEGKKWNMRRWADYYESKGNKIVRNVISLEVSQSKLGRLIKRPQIVRELDLQDSVWPLELQAKGEIPRVQFYCLMSVADCFTDFHIDFGGSSVFYHILKGKKTFFFIPPKEKHLKKYEEWCLSPAQNWTFLGNQTKECYRVDLDEGDTMFIPAGWIHAVWTPEDSLVIGGNFLTRLNYGMQLRISQIEKATGVARKFRYPHFQKIHWYTAFRYLEDDPLPHIVQKLLQEGEIFYREKPAHHEFNDWGENSKSGLGNYQARYYSQAELEGLPDLTRYLLRTALIDLGSITEGITQETRNAVKRSIPRGHGEPLEVVKKFAAWCAWKRGNETIPSWAYPDAVPEPESAGKVSAAVQKKLDREAALQAPRRQSARMQSQQNALNTGAGTMDGNAQGLVDGISNAFSTSDTVSAVLETSHKRKLSDPDAIGQFDVTNTGSKKRRTASGTGSNSHRKVACESCRKRRRACKHKDTKDVLYPDQQTPTTVADAVPPISGPQIDALIDLASTVHASSVDDSTQLSVLDTEDLATVDLDTALVQQDGVSEEAKIIDTDDTTYLLKDADEIASTPKMLTHLSGAGLLRLEHRIAGGPVNGLSVLSLNAPHSRGRTKACNDCRKSKRRCIHDEYGNEDPIKAAETAVPRPAAANKRRKFDSEGNEIPSAKRSRKSSGNLPPTTAQEMLDFETPSKAPSQQAPVANVVGTPMATMMQNSFEQETGSPGQSDMILSTFDQIQAAADFMPPIDPLLTQTSEIQPEETAANPPAPAARSGTTLPEPAPQDFLPQQSSGQQNQLQGAPSPTPSMTHDFPIDPALEHMSSSFSVPAASLVSPPASSHADTSRTPLSPSASSSRHSSRYPNQMQRYTPESGPRRDSSSSSVDEPPLTGNDGRASTAVSEAMAMGKDTSPMTTISTTGEDERKGDTGELDTATSPLTTISPVGEDERKNEASRRKSRSSTDGVADEESLKLIKALQAQDYGLRRRGKV